MSHKELFIGNVWYPSVTTIMDAEPKPWLDAWRDKWGILAERKVKICAALGQEFHRCVESWLDTGTYSVQSPTDEETGITISSLIPRIQGMMKSWMMWAVSIEGIIEHTELQVRSEMHTYSGTLDAVGFLGKKPMVFDWKTSSRIYPDMQIQLAAYAQAYNEMRQTPEWIQLYPETGQFIKFVKDGMIVHVSKDKPNFKLTTKQFKLGKRAFGKFLKLRSMFDDIKNIPKEAGGMNEQS